MMADTASHIYGPIIPSTTTAFGSEEASTAFRDPANSSPPVTEAILSPRRYCHRGDTVTEAILSPRRYCHRGDTVSCIEWWAEILATL